jgi:cell division septation protein DedD
MRDENVRPSEKFELSLDGRQIASIVVGALVILGVVFVLGLNVGRQVAVRQAEVARSGDLDALDRPPAPAPTSALDGATLTFHDRLTKGRAAPELAAAAAPVPATKAAIAETIATPAATPAAAPASTATSVASPTPTPSPTATKSAVTPDGAKASAADAVRGGAYTIQVGAAQERSDAERLATRLRTYRPRVEPAEVDGKGRWYRVRVGSFASRDEAERTRKDVARATGVSGYVTASR